MKKLLPIVLPVLFISSFSALGEDQKPVFKLDDKKEEARQDAVAKADSAATAEVEKVQAELDKKLAEAKKKAAVARIAAREKVIEELTKEKKKAMLAEKLDEALAYKAKIEEVQKEVDELEKEGMDAVAEKGVNLEDPKRMEDAIVGKWEQARKNEPAFRLWIFNKDKTLERYFCDKTGKPTGLELKATWFVDKNNSTFHFAGWHVESLASEKLFWGCCDCGGPVIVRFRKIQTK